jgi:hypothetical protein
MKENREEVPFALREKGEVFFMVFLHVSSWPSW